MSLICGGAEGYGGDCDGLPLSSTPILPCEAGEVADGVNQLTEGGLGVDSCSGLRPCFFVEPAEERVGPRRETFQDAGGDGEVLQLIAGMTAQEAREARSVFFPDG